MAAGPTSTASGVLNIARQVGSALAIAVFGALVADQATFPPARPHPPD